MGSFAQSCSRTLGASARFTVIWEATGLFVPTLESFAVLLG